MLAQDSDGCERLRRRYIAAAGHDDIRLSALVVARETPDADALGTVNYRLLDGAELQMLLLVRDDDVDAIGRTQALVRNHQQCVGIRWQIDPRHARALVGHDVDEPGILVREAIVILTPHGR